MFVGLDRMLCGVLACVSGSDDREGDLGCEPGYREEAI